MEISPITNPKRKLILDVKVHFEWQCVTLMVGAKFFWNEWKIITYSLYSKHVFLISLKKFSFIVHSTDKCRLDLIIPGESHFYLRASNPQERQQWLVSLGTAKASLTNGRIKESAGNIFQWEIFFLSFFKIVLNLHTDSLKKRDIGIWLLDK